MANPTNLVEPPRRRPRKGGIKAVANVLPAPRLFASAALDWLGEPCEFPVDAPGLCWGAVVPDDPKQAQDGISEEQSNLVFGGYTGVECWDLASADDFEARARRTLEQGEDRYVEGKLLALLASIDSTPTVVGGWVDAIAQAEETADAAYLGQPVIVMSRFGAVQAKAADAIDGDEDGNLWTPNGTPVLATGSFPPATETNLYITGDITMWHSDLVATTVTDPTRNTALSIAERAYALGIDCNYAVAYNVTIAP